MSRSVKLLSVLFATLLVAGLLLHSSRAQATERWVAVGQLQTARAGACSVQLSDGRTLITGGESSGGVLSSAEVFDSSGSFTDVASMLYSHADHVCAALEDGRVLVAGGRLSGTTPSNIAEAYDPAKNTWSLVSTMMSARIGATASVLKGGRVLIAGGDNGASLGSLESFDPSSNTFELLSASLSAPRKNHAAAVLRDGRVLFAGGVGNGAPLDTVEVFDPKSGAIDVLGRMSAQRSALTATTLLDGTVLLAGGLGKSGDLALVEVVDAQKRTIAAAASLPTPRHGQQAVRLKDNNAVLFVGGTSSGADAQVYIPWQGKFKSFDDFKSPRRPAKVGSGSGTRLASAQTASPGDSVPTVTTDKTDYSPGQIVTITGSNWNPGETITLHFEESPLIDTHPDLTATVAADGTFTNAEFMPDAHDLNITFTVTATASPSGMTAATTFTDGPVNLFQCANGQLGNVQCLTTQANTGWKNGLVGQSVSRYFEGDSIPYQFIITVPPNGDHTLTIQFDTTKSSKHAEDYLTDWNISALPGSDPCSGVDGLGSCVNSLGTTVAVPPDPHVVVSSPCPTGNPNDGLFHGCGGPAYGHFSFFGPASSITAGAYTVNGTWAGGVYTGDTSESITLSFHVGAANACSKNSCPGGNDIANVVMAVGGHISTRLDWGLTNSAISISGAPYHMAVGGFDGNVGSQDAQLSADAVIFPGSITIIKSATPTTTSPAVTFPFTASPSPLTNFNLDASNSAGATTTFNGITVFPTGGYTITEGTLPTGWAFDSISTCTVTSPNGGTAPISGNSVDIKMNEGENWTCIFNNHLQSGTIELKKHWVGTAGSATLNIGTSAGGTQVKSTAVSGADGTTGTQTVNTGTYYVSETGALTNYSQSLACTDNGVTVTPGASNSLSVADTHTVICTFTNTLKASIELKKIWSGTGGQTTLNVGTAAGGSQVASQQTGADGAAPLTTGTQPVNPGTYYVSETGGLTNYDSGLACTDNGSPATVGANNSLTLAAGDTAVCTFTNTRQQGSIELKKIWSGTAGQTTLNIGTSAGGTQAATQLTGVAGAAPLSTGAKTVDTGTYYVSESGGLTNYDSSLACTDNGSPVTPGANNSLAVAKGDVVVCTFTNTRQQGSVTLNKIWSGTAGQTTLNIGTSAGGAQVATQLTGVAGAAPLSTGAKTVDTGTYYFTETGGLTNYDSSLACTDNGSPATVGSNNSLAIAKGDVVVCTFTNTRQQGSITLNKLWVGTPGQTTLNIGTSANGTDTASVQTGAAGVAPQTTGTKTVDTATYYVSESGGPTNYDASLACTDNGSPVTPGANNSLVVGKNDVVVCTFTNSIKGTITLNKIWTGTPGQTTLNIGTSAGGTQVATQLTGAAGVAPLTTGSKTVSAGNYYVSETGGLTNYDSSLACTDNSIAVTPGANNSLAVADNHTVICTFTNVRQQGSITLNKLWVGTPGQTTLNIGTSANGTQTASVQTGAAGAAPQTTGTKTVDTATYYVSETGGLTNYDASLACTDNGITATIGANNSVVVGKNDVVVCTFTNTIKGTITLNKIWTGTPGQTTLTIGTSLGGAQTASTQTGAAGAAPLTTGAKTVTAGTYYLAETGGLTNYTPSLACTDNGSPTTVGANSSVAVADNHTVVCTFTNVRQQGSIELKKSWVGAGGQTTLKIGTTAAGSDVASQLTGAAGAAPLTTSAKSVDTGIYYVSETGGLTGYFPSLACTDNGSPVTPGANNSLTVGYLHTVVCTFTNTQAGSAKVIKTVNAGGAQTPATFNFDLRTGADSSTSAGTVIESGTVNGTSGGTITFSTLLVPGTHYQICEQIIEPGWFTTLGPNPFALYNPGGLNIGEVCTDFTVTAGQLITFNVNNFFPSTQGLGSTIGFWKNWASCAGSKGGQLPKLDQTLAVSEALAPPPYGPGITIGILTLNGNVATPNLAPDCLSAVELLNKSTVASSLKNSVKEAADPAFNLAAQLLGAILNFDAGAAMCPNDKTVVNYADTLLAAHGFKGVTGYTSFSAAEASLANQLATLLDTYNNNGPCPASLPTLPAIAPVFTSANTVTFKITTGAGSPFTVKVQGGYPLTLSEAGGLPPGVTFNSTTGVLSYVVTAQVANTYHIFFTATNNTGGSTTQPFTLNMQ
jgi:hypothetical protein